MRGSTRLIAVALFLTSAASTASADEPPKNLKYFPKTIARDALIQRMREFSFALGVRCQHCHAGGDGVSFEGVNFASDEKTPKVKARAMLRMVDTLNGQLLAKLPARHSPPVKMDCVICHRGLPIPKTLATELTEVVDTKGIPAAVARYRELRAKQMTLGRWAFDEWTMNEVARSLAVDGKADAAIAMLELNAEFYPASADIDLQLGELHRTRGEREKAIARYKAALAKSPESTLAAKRLEELEKAP
jgi:Photosynthetic reaction centre cytochrome C subunit